ncbi:biotin-dependent carboxyltransferase family protein [Actinotalea sp. JY-7885]|uniref:5-oxoprolinase subunit C family protein n=1 Tax=Actinotalea sp. JY-7885 TaxID=2758576 RepID=UPI00165DDBDF|nr:biotin-dependent carboxyltransferase family protein [Actinotalea sp. JY-7885]
MSAWHAVGLAEGDVLTVPEPPSGLRSYVAVRGGLDGARVLGSRSSDVLGGLGPGPVAAGAVLGVRGEVSGAVGAPEPPVVPEAGAVRVRAVPGPDVPRPGRDGATGPALWHVPWTVATASNRIGLRLEGRALPPADAGERPSQGVLAGGVQLPPSGLPVVFLVDHPVTGGYPVVATVVDADLDRLAQLRPGQTLVLVPEDR